MPNPSSEPFTFRVPPDLAGELCWLDALRHARSHPRPDAADRWALFTDHEPSEFGAYTAGRLEPKPTRILLCQVAFGPHFQTEVMGASLAHLTELESFGLTAYVFARALQSAVAAGVNRRTVELALSPQRGLVQPFGAIRKPEWAVAVENLTGRAGLLDFHSDQPARFLAGGPWTAVQPR